MKTTRIRINDKYQYLVTGKRGGGKKGKKIADVANTTLSAIEVMSDGKVAKAARLVKELLGIFSRR